MQPKMSRRIIAKAIAVKLTSEPAQKSHWIKVLAAYLLETKQTATADLVINDILREIARLQGDVLVDIQTARDMNPTLRQDITHMLRDILKAKRVVLRETVDPDLLGGLVIRTPEAQLDASIRTKLKQLASLEA